MFRMVEEARQGRSLRLWLCGPSGVGKTRLLGELERYAVWRGVALERMSPEDRPHGWKTIGNTPRVRIVDSVRAAALATLEEKFREIDAGGLLTIAATRDQRALEDLGVRRSSMLVLGPLGREESLRVLRGLLGRSFDPAWAEQVLGSTGRSPSWLHQTAARRLSM